MKKYVFIAVILGLVLGLAFQNCSNVSFIGMSSNESGDGGPGQEPDGPAPIDPPSDPPSDPPADPPAEFACDTWQEENWVEDSLVPGAVLINSIRLLYSNLMFASTYQSVGVYRRAQDGSWVYDGLGDVNQVFDVVTYAGYVYAATSGGLRRRPIAGTEWSTVFFNEVWSLLVVPGKLIIGASYPAAIYETVNGTDINLVQSLGGSGTRTWSLAQYGAGSQYIFAGTSTNEGSGAYIYRSSDFGQTFSATLTPSAKHITSIISVGTNELLASGWGTFSGVLKSVDGGLTWTSRESGYVGGTTWSLVNHNGVVYLGGRGLDNKKVMRSFDKGETWCYSGETPNGNYVSSIRFVWDQLYIGFHGSDRVMRATPVPAPQ